MLKTIQIVSKKLAVQLILTQLLILYSKILRIHCVIETTGYRSLWNSSHLRTVSAKSLRISSASAESAAFVFLLVSFTKLKSNPTTKLDTKCSKYSSLAK